MAAYCMCSVFDPDTQKNGLGAGARVSARKHISPSKRTRARRPTTPSPDLTLKEGAVGRATAVRACAGRRARENAAAPATGSLDHASAFGPAPAPAKRRAPIIIF
eukprot:scaffold7397_cov108-Isochrysis_galbana.AAC.2